MARELREEDRRIAERLGRIETPDEPPGIGANAGYLGQGISAIYDAEVSEQKALESPIRESESVVICGVAPRALVDAIQAVAKDQREAGAPAPWDSITYVTPSPSLISANRGGIRLGSLVHRWRYALDGIQSCIGQLNKRRGAESGAQIAFRLVGMDELYLQVTVIVVRRATKRKRAYVSVGPSRVRDEATFLVLEEGTALFGQIEHLVTEAVAGGSPISSRQVECDPPLVASSQGDLPAEVDELPALQVKTLVPNGTPQSDSSFCLPIAVVVVRSAAAGQQIVLLKRRSEFADYDDLGRLSLLSSRLLEEDLSAGLGVQLFADQAAREALDAMWTSVGARDPLTAPMAAFKLAAQRELYVSCGLDLPTNRFEYRGWHLLEREDDGSRLFFCVFETVLYRRKAKDELAIAEGWNKDNLARIADDDLYNDARRKRLNRLLLQRKQWLLDHIFSNPIDAFGAEPGLTGP